MTVKMLPSFSLENKIREREHTSLFGSDWLNPRCVVEQTKNDLWLINPTDCTARKQTVSLATSIVFLSCQIIRKE